MPGTVTEELERTEATSGDHGPGERGPVRDGGDGDGGRSRGGPSDRPETPRRAYFTGLAIGLAAILMFFLALASAYVVRKGLGGDWQPIALPPVLWLNTVVLVCSSLALENARRGYRLRQPARFRAWWMAGTLLGVGFLVGQVVGWQQLAAQGIFLSSNPSSSFFYVFTAAHGLHLVGGVIALAWVAARGWAHTVRTEALAADLASRYWHFMDGVWLFLLVLFFVGR